MEALGLALAPRPGSEKAVPCGNEGAGVVVETGPGVKDLKVGDHVIPLYTPECRECEYCLNPKTNLCQAIRETQGKGLMPDGTSRFSMLDGTPILHYMGCSTFSNYTDPISSSDIRHVSISSRDVEYYC